MIADSRRSGVHPTKDNAFTEEDESPQQQVGPQGFEP